MEKPFYARPIRCIKSGGTSDISSTKIDEFISNLTKVSDLVANCSKIGIISGLNLRVIYFAHGNWFFLGLWCGQGIKRESHMIAAVMSSGCGSAVAHTFWETELVNTARKDF